MGTGCNPNPVQSDLFKQRRAEAQATIARCQGKRRSDGGPCGQAALRGGKFCKRHGGLLGAAAAEAERYGRPVIILRRPQNQRLGRLGVEMAWPAGIPRRADLLALGPLGRGRLFEAWLNRALAPDVWKYELTRPRYRKEGRPRTASPR
jgi:hypothetical protein